MRAFVWPVHLPALPPHGRPTLAVSFRRGDYNIIGSALPWGWYEQAIGMARKKIGEPTLVCFGDDPDFVSLACDRLSATSDVVNAFDLAVDPVAQLFLLAACDHCVLANSTFAWWGAWIGDRRTPPGRPRVVIVPAEFAGSGDRVPPRWATIPAGVTNW